MSKKKSESKKIKESCDKLWSLIVRGRANNECQIPECPNKGTDAHHIEGRGLSVRWDLDNGICLCQSHHVFGKEAAHATKYSGQKKFHRLMVDLYGSEFFEDLAFKSNQIRKWRITELRELKKELTEELNNMSRSTLLQ